MDVNSDITGFHAEPGFHHEARYEIKVHFDGADQETVTYRFSFGVPEASGRQPLRLHTLTGSDAREDSAEGVLVLEGRTGEQPPPQESEPGQRVQEAFHVDLDLLAVVNGAVGESTAVDLTSWNPRDARNSFAGTTVEAIVLEVPHGRDELRPAREPVCGARPSWRPTPAAGDRSTARAIP